VGTDYSGGVIVDNAGAIRVVVIDKDLAGVSALLSESSLRHTSKTFGGNMVELRFGSDVSAGDVRTILTRYAELT
jgi:hypothetical protein